MIGVKIKKIFLSFVTIILVVIFGLVLYRIVAINVFKVSNPSFFGYYFYRVLSGSMEPSIEIGDYVLVKEDDDLVVGDVITYKVDNNFITHRIVDITSDTIVTKGDNNNTSDDPILYNQVVGKVIYVFL